MSSPPALSCAVIGAAPAAAAIIKRLAGAGVGIHDEDAAAAERLCAELGARHLAGVDALLEALPAPRVVWLAAEPKHACERLLADLASRLAAGDVVADAGEGDFREAMHRAQALGREGIGYADVVHAAGDWAADRGRVLAVGGDAAQVEALRPHLDRLAPLPEAVWGLCGPAGSGRFVRAVEQELGRGLVSALAEGFEVFAQGGLRLQPGELARVWQRGGACNAALGRLAAEFLDSVGWTQASGAAPPAVSLALSLCFAAQGVEFYFGQLSALMAAAAGQPRGADER